jgi:hypothetical protein
VTRPHLTIAAALLGLLLAGPVGVATAQDEPTPSDNQPPVAGPDRAEVEPGESVTVPVLDNDADPEGAELTVVGISGGRGRANFTTDSVTFAALDDDSGEFVVQYDVSDGEQQSTGQLTVLVERIADRAVSVDVADRPVALRRYAFHGSVRPSVRGAVVRVQHRTRDGWRLVGKDRTSDRGRYRVPYRTADPGRKTFRAKATFPNGDKVRSDPITRKVRALIDVTVSGPLSPRQVPHSWRRGCPVPPRQLRMIHLNHWAYDRDVARGRLVVRTREVGDVVKVLRGAFQERFPIRRIRPADRFYAGGRRTPMGSDKAAMRAGNTSAFNCRPVTGNPYRMSQHSYGNAIDINTIENPYVTGSRVYPHGSRRYLDRSPYRRGMLLGGGVVVSRMRQLGWLWGARWAHPDYQHFSSNGG